MEKARTWRANVGLSHSENVYVMWWTGVDTMPLLVKVCVENLRRHIHAHSFHLITRENVYMLFPTLTNEINTLVKLLESDKIRIQHFSDLLRTLILINRGGCWVDATVFITPSWDSNMLGLSFFSGRRTKTFANSGKSITNGQWTSYFIASVKNNPLLRFIYDGLNE